MLNYLSVTSGIAADTVAWGPLGWQCVAYAEIEPFPCAVLDYHYGCGAPEVMPSPLCAKTPKDAKRLEAMLRANVKLPPRAQGCPPNLGDIRSVTGKRIRELLEASGLGHLNILMGGVPCQDYSVAGLRADGFDASEDGTGRGTPLVAAIAIRGREGGCNLEMRTDGLANTVLTPSGGRAGIGVGAVLRVTYPDGGLASPDTPSVLTGQSPAESCVRRLLPLECELLMGLPPGYTLIPFGRAVKAEKMEPDYADFLIHCGCLTLEDACRAAADGPRYKSHGNSIAVPVLRWLGERIEKFLLPVLALKEAKALAESFNNRLKTRSEVLAESEKQFDAIMAELREAAV